MVLKRNLPSSVSSRLNPWEEATVPRSPAMPDVDEGFRPKRQSGTNWVAPLELRDTLPDTDITDPALSWPKKPEREPRNLLEAVQAAARRKGLLPQAPEPEFDYPMLGRTMKTLTTILGRHPKAGDLIPANHVDAYLKALSADQFDKRDNLDFFKHVEGAYKQAHPKTVYDATGRMVDSPPIAIAFNPFGDEVPRAQPQNAGLGTGMPGIMKASFPGNYPKDWKGAFERAGETIGKTLRLKPQADKADTPTPTPDAALEKDASQRKIDWKPAEYSVTDGAYDVFTSGAVRIDATHVSPGIDGTAYTVEWFALDPDGKVRPNIRGDRPLQPRGGWIFPPRNEDVIEPPFDNEYGYMVRVHVPLRESNRGDAPKVPLDIYTEQDWRTDR